MRILITDLHNAANRGDSAILAGMLQVLSQEFPQATFLVATDSPATAQALNEVETVQQPFTTFSWRRLDILAAMIYVLIAARLRRLGLTLPGITHPRLRAYQEADVVISKGGGFLSGYYTTDVLSRIWGLYFARTLGKPVIVYAQSIGPFAQPWLRWIVAFVLNRVTLITLRDEESRAVLANLRISKPPVHVTADAAFSLPLAQPQSLPDLRYESLPGSAGDLRVSISVRSVRLHVGSQAHHQYVEAMARLVQWLIEEKGARVFFLSTCTGLGGYHNDDRMTAHEIIQQMQRAQGRGAQPAAHPNPAIVYGEYTCQEISRFYGQMTLHIGTRMHSNILALLQGTPVVAIEYEFKTSGLMRQLGLQEYVIDAHRIGLEELERQVEAVLERQEALRALIAERLPGLKQASRANARLVCESLGLSRQGVR